MPYWDINTGQTDRDSNFNYSYFNILLELRVSPHVVVSLELYSRI